MGSILPAINRGGRQVGGRRPERSSCQAQRSFLPEQFSSLEISPSRTARYSFMGTRGGSGHAALPCISARIVSVPCSGRTPAADSSADESRNGADRRPRGDETPRQIRLQVGQVGLRSELAIVCGAGLQSSSRVLALTRPNR